MNGIGAYDSYQKNINLHPFPTSYTRVDSIWNEDVNVKNTKILKEKNF